jgi:hypothetical protein
VLFAHGDNGDGEIDPQDEHLEQREREKEREREIER